MVTPSFVTTGEPVIFSRITLRPLGPSVDSRPRPTDPRLPATDSEHPRQNAVLWPSVLQCQGRSIDYVGVRERGWPDPEPGRGRAPGGLPRRRRAGMYACAG